MGKYTHALLEYTNAHNNTIKNIKALFLYDFDLNSVILLDIKILSKGRTVSPTSGDIMHKHLHWVKSIAETHSDATLGYYY